MAITGTDRGTGGNNTGSTSLVCSPSTTIPANSGGVLVVACDNAGGSGGAGPTCPSSVTDSVGNVWTLQANATRDPGAASAGAELGIYVCESLTTQLTSANNVTLNWVGGVTVAAKAFAFNELTPTDATKKMSFLSGSALPFASAQTITTPSINSGDVVVAGGAIEASAGAWTGDADTTNGSWTAQQTAGFGTTTSGMVVTSQRKIVTGTATQTYNPTGSGDNVIGYVILTEVNRLNLVNFESMGRGMNRGMGRI